MRKLDRVMVTGGAGFIGSNFIRYLFRKTGFGGTVINADALTYAGNLENLADIQSEYGGGRYLFERVDIADYEALLGAFRKHRPDTVVHFAAESHVDRSIYGPKDFVCTNVIGTFNLLEAVRERWKEQKGVHFHHVSTDEVYGSLDRGGFFYEHTPYDPHSPYAASKASSDHLVRAYSRTYGVPVTLSNCSNNYGPFQFPEKMVPLMILNMLEGRQLPLYGDGRHVRDWLYVEDHATAIWLILNRGRTGQTYNIGGDCQLENRELLDLLCELVAARTGTDPGRYRELVTPVADRPGHDRRYAINFDKLRNALGWEPATPLREGLDRTIAWYLENPGWVDRVRSGAYREWIEKNYSSR
ncbi:MAG: dTDP-glucose 4,6-dehydratase [Spirochaetota bacterium]